MRSFKSLNFKDNQELEDYLEEYYLDVPLGTYPEFFGAFVGVIEGKGIEPKVCYDYTKTIDIIMDQLAENESEMCAEDKHYKDWHGDAVEHFEFNVIGAYHGDHTPAFLYRDMEEV